MAHGGLGAWRERLVAVLSLLAWGALAPLSLIPLALLVTAAGTVFSAAIAAVLDGIPPSAAILGRVAVALVALPAATVSAQVCVRLHQWRAAALWGLAAPPESPGEPVSPLLRGLRFVLGRDAWTAVGHSTLLGLGGLAVGGVPVLLIALGAGGFVGGLGVLVAVGFTPATAATGVTAPVALLILGPLLVGGVLWAAPWLQRCDRALARRILVDSPQVRVRRRLRQLSDPRSRMVDAAEAERRRIERDLHDGAQQRLLALSLTLARARAKFDRDPEGARALVEEARRESRAVIADLRDVAQGLHPRVLTDHGLEAALPVAAARCPVPVRLDIHLDERPSPRAEGVAYYVVCEALTNVAKHADAAAVTVRAERVRRRRGDLLRVTVTDNGRGGADPRAGTGLHGLADRVEAVDGDLFLHSPPGEGTVLTADIPWKA